LPGLFDFLAPHKRLLQQQREIRRLAREVSELRAQNDSMRQGMRRCVTCEYRIDFKQRQGGADIKPD
jgi:prefoldin subunit 5